MTLAVRVQPRASREGVSGTRGGALCVRLTAPPVEGEANAALVRFLARALHLPAQAVTLVGGAQSRDKRVRIEGVSAEKVQALAPAEPR